MLRTWLLAKHQCMHAWCSSLRDLETAEPLDIYLTKVSFRRNSIRIACSSDKKYRLLVIVTPTFHTGQINLWFHNWFGPPYLVLNVQHTVTDMVVRINKLIWRVFSLVFFYNHFDRSKLPPFFRSISRHSQSPLLAAKWTAVRWLYSGTGLLIICFRCCFFWWASLINCVRPSTQFRCCKMAQSRCASLSIASGIIQMKQTREAIWAD